MSDRLIVLKTASDEWAIAWYIEEDSDYGLYIGQEYPNTWEAFLELQQGTMPLREIRMWWECTRLAFEDLRTVSDTHLNDAGAICWSTKRRAAAILKQAGLEAKIFIQHRENWPAWAKTALLEGWTPPRRWKP